MQNGNDDEDFDGPTTQPGTTTAIQITQAALRDLFTRMRTAAIAGLQVVDALPGLSETTLRTCLDELERQCREVGAHGHDTARALHDLLIERRKHP